MPVDFKSSIRSIDFRIYRPASVLVVDLVSHTSREKRTIQTVQRIMEDVFRRAQETLRLDNVHFNYTGDGYVCAFVGDSSARVLDFINCTIPDLARRFAQYDQKLRVGIDFGLIHLTQNVLTGGYEHFDLPAIQAARLEKAARPGQILCTENVHLMFAPHYPEMFSTEPEIVRTKDRDINAFEILPFDILSVQQLFSDYLFRRPGATTETPVERRKILFVDDESGILFGLCDYFGFDWKDFEVVGAEGVRDALATFKSGEFAIVVTDYMLVDGTGIDLLERLLAIDEDLTVVVFTAHGSEDLAKRCLSMGAYYFATKPIELPLFSRVLRIALSHSSHRTLRTALQILCEDLGGFLWLMQRVSDDLDSILHDQADDGGNVAKGLLRHKAKQIVMDFAACIQPGTDVLKSLSAVKVQLACVSRLARVIGRVRMGDLYSYLGQYVADLRKLNPNVEFVLSYTPNDGNASSIPLSAEVILVICELLDNAISAIERSGKIDVTISVLESAGLLQIVVRDTGPGIPEELKGRAFDEGVSTKGAGRGLGLSLVREAVRLLKGEISYEHQGGASFSIVLPLS